MTTATITGFHLRHDSGEEVYFTQDTGLRERLTFEQGQGDGSVLILVTLDLDGSVGVHRVGFESLGAEAAVDDVEHLDRAIAVLQQIRGQLTSES